MNIEPNIFSFATRELSQDAFICWLVSHINHSDNHKLHECAKDFVVMLYNLKNDTERIHSSDVEKIEEGPKRQYKHTDVYFQISLANKDKVPFLIEDKTHSTSLSSKLENYRNEVSQNDKAEDRIVCVYYKTGYMLPEEIEEVERSEFCILDYKKIYEFLQKYHTDNVIFESYKQYILETFYEPYTTWMDKFMNGQRITYLDDTGKEPFSEKFIQYKYLQELQKRCTETIFSDSEDKSCVYGGNNKDGMPWMELEFANIKEVYGKEKNDDKRDWQFNERLFYRLDKSKRGYYLSLRQYAKINNKDTEVYSIKQERCKTYRKIFESIDAAKSMFTDKPCNRGVYGKEIAVLFFDEETNTPSKVLESMKPIHTEFVEKVNKLNPLCV